MNTVFQFLVSGYDTIQCAYHLHATGRGELDFVRLSAHREELRQAKVREGMPIQLGSEEFLLMPHGTASGYPLLLENPAFGIECGEFNKPNFFVTFRSYALWHDGVQGLHQRFLTWADSVGMSVSRAESLSRVDYAFDYYVPEVDFDEDNFVTTAEKDEQYRKNRRLQSFRFGKGQIVLRGYDKSAEIAEKSEKTWFYSIWGRAEDVWRFEWQIRKAVLRFRGVRTFDDLQRGGGDVIRPLVESSATLRMKTSDSNRSRWPLHPLWIDLQSRVAALDACGVIRECDPQVLLEARLMRCGISVYGYLKRIAAICGLQGGDGTPNVDQAMRRLGWLVNRLHDPLAWDSGVQKRMDQMRLGQW